MIKITSQQVRPLKGAPLSVLILLERSPVALSNTALERLSGYSDKPISQACFYLQELGLVNHNREGWFLAPGMLVEETTRNNSEAINIINPLSLTMSVNNNNNKVLNKGRNISDTEEEEIWQVLAAAGVKKNQRTRGLLEKEHVTAEYVNAKVAEYKAHGMSGTQWAGLLIRKIEEGEPAPPNAENGHPQGCSCVSCKVERFLRGEK